MITESVEYLDEEHRQRDLDWEALCKSEYAKYKSEHPQPFITDFPWNPHWYFDRAEDWSKGWLKHIRVIGAKFFAERGYKITNWPANSQERITVEPIDG